MQSWTSECGRVVLYKADCRDLAPELGPFETCVTDPPYHLTSTNSRKVGFMGSTWDGGGVAHDPETWSKIFKALRPGSFVLAFGGPRTFHRLACAVEDAGALLKDTLCWLVSSGFPKSLNISKAMDKAQGAEREVVGRYQFPPDHPRPNKDLERWDQRQAEAGARANVRNAPDGGYRMITAPATEEAKLWDGWGTSLKPSWESIILAQLPNRSLTSLDLALILTVVNTEMITEVLLCQLEWLSRVDTAGVLSRRLRERLREVGENTALKFVWDNPNEDGLLAFANIVDLYLNSVSQRLERVGVSFAAESVREYTNDPSQENTALTGRVVALFALMDMLLSRLEHDWGTDLNTIWLWKGILGAPWVQPSRFTMSMVIDLITDLKILNSSLSQSTFENTIRIKNDLKSGRLCLVSTVASHLNGVLTRWRDILRRSVRGAATSNIAALEASAFEPHFEPIVCAMLPLDGTYVVNALRHGVAGLWVDGCRVGNAVGHPYTSRESTGRWPSNVVLTHSRQVWYTLANEVPSHVEEEILAYYGIGEAMRILRSNIPGVPQHVGKAKVLLEGVRWIESEGTAQEGVGPASVSGVRSSVRSDSRMGSQREAEILLEEMPREGGCDRASSGKTTHAREQREDGQGRDGKVYDGEVESMAWWDVLQSGVQERYDSSPDGQGALFCGTDDNEQIHTGASSCSSREGESCVEGDGCGSSHQRGQGRQQTGELSGSQQSEAFGGPSSIGKEITLPGDGKRTAYSRERRIEVAEELIPDRWRDWFVVSAVEGCQRRFVRRPDMRGDNYGQGKEAYEDRSPLYYEVENKGRWPTNVVFTHNERCERTGTKRVKASGTSKKFHEGYWTEAAAEFFSGVSHPGNQHGDPDGMETVEDWACVNECPVRQLNEQVGLVQSGSRKPGVVRDVGYHGARKENVAPPVKGSVGHASRFYVCLPGDVLSDLHFREHGDPLLRFLYCSKASKKERTVHGAVENKHPTVKPIKLMEWLCRITKTPTGGTVFDPFCGTGTTAIAALLTGRRFVGIEQDSENFDIAWRRIDAWIRRHDPKQLTLLDVG